MSTRTILAGALAGCSLCAAPLEAQRFAAQPAARPASFELAPYAGYLVSEDFISGPFGTSVGIVGAPVYGGQLGIALTPGVSLVGNVGRSSARLRAGIPFVGGFEFGESTTWLYDGGIQFGAPVGRGALPVVPFVQLGVGGIHREIEVAGLSTKATNHAFHAGLGVDLGLAPNLALRLLARDYVGKFDFKEAIYLDLDGDTMHNVALTAGLRLAF